MSSRLIERMTTIRGQIFTVLMGALFFGAIILAIVFYYLADYMAKRQMENSYVATGSMVAGLSAYDFQFNKSGLKETVDAMVKADANMLWVEFSDAQGTSQQAAGPLESAPYKDLASLTPGERPKPISTSLGSALLVRASITGSAAPATEGIGELGFAEPAAPAADAVPTALGELRLVVGLKPLADLRQKYLLIGPILVLLTLAAGSLLAWVVTKYLVAPLDRLTAYAQRIAEGNLTSGQAEAQRTDEIGRLVVSFQTMAGNLATMIRQIRTAFEAVKEDTEAVRRVLSQNVESNREQTSITEQVADRMASIQRSAETVSHLMEGLSQMAEEVSSSVLEMIASIDEIAANAEGLTEAVNTAASTLSENVAAIREIDSSAETLNRFVEETSSATTEMETAIRQVQQNAEQTRKSTETVMKEAQSGTSAMERSESVIQQLQATFESTVEAMKLLGQRSEEVGNILAVIDEVMEQTHLLALNAAIIAAQAGEHGKSFAVVAGEIRALAEKTSLSTREIASLVDSVQREVQRAVQAVSAQNALVEQSVAVTRDTRSALDRIQASVGPSMKMTEEIARATSEQARGASGIVRSAEQVRDLTHQLKRATKEQRLGSEQILDAVNRIRSLSEEVKRATREQSAGSTIIRQAMDGLNTAVGKVMGQTQTQTAASKDVEKVMESFSKAARGNLAGLQKAAEQVEALSRRSEEVSEEMARFRTEGG